MVIAAQQPAGTGAQRQVEEFLVVGIAAAQWLRRTFLAIRARWKALHQGIEAGRSGFARGPVEGQLRITQHAQPLLAAGRTGHGDDVAGVQCIAQAQAARVIEHEQVQAYVRVQHDAGRGIHGRVGARAAYCVSRRSAEPMRHCRCSGVAPSTTARRSVYVPVKWCWLPSRRVVVMATGTSM